MHTRIVSSSEERIRGSSFLADLPMAFSTPLPTSFSHSVPHDGMQASDNGLSLYAPISRLARPISPTRLIQVITSSVYFLSWRKTMIQKTWR